MTTATITGPFASLKRVGDGSRRWHRRRREERDAPDDPPADAHDRGADPGAGGDRPAQLGRDACTDDA